MTRARVTRGCQESGFLRQHPEHRLLQAWTTWTHPIFTRFRLLRRFLTREEPSRNRHDPGPGRHSRTPHPGPGAGLSLTVCPADDADMLGHDTSSGKTEVHPGQGRPGRVGSWYTHLGLPCHMYTLLSAWVHRHHTVTHVQGAVHWAG